MSAIRWHKDPGDRSIGWLPERDMRTDEHDFEVREVEPGVFAGFERDRNGEFFCVTMDYDSDHGGRVALENYQ